MMAKAFVPPEPTVILAEVEAVRADRLPGAARIVYQGPGAALDWWTVHGALRAPQDARWLLLRVFAPGDHRRTRTLEVRACQLVATLFPGVCAHQRGAAMLSTCTLEPVVPGALPDISEICAAHRGEMLRLLPLP